MLLDLGLIRNNKGLFVEYHIIPSFVPSFLKKELFSTRDIDLEGYEVFDYVNQSTVNSSNAYKADIIAYDKNHDLAILKIDSPKKFDHVAPLIPENKIKDLRLFEHVVVSGCTMAHEPFCTYGQLTFLKEIIEQKIYVMYNAGSYFGNSDIAEYLMGHSGGMHSYYQNMKKEDLANNYLQYMKNVTVSATMDTKRINGLEEQLEKVRKENEQLRKSMQKLKAQIIEKKVENNEELIKTILSMVQDIEEYLEYRKE